MPTKKLSPALEARLTALKDFIRAAGGELHVAFNLSTPEAPLSQLAVRRWTRPEVARVPDIHWPGLARLADRDEMDLYRIHQMPR